MHVQQDNARLQVSSTDDVPLEEGREFGSKIKLTNQPANSLDLNILDLGVLTLDSLNNREKVPLILIASCNLYRKHSKKHKEKQL